MKKRRGLVVFAVLIGAFVAYAALAPNKIDPAPAWDPPVPPALEGPLAENTILQRTRPIARGQIIGPESAVTGPDGLIYTGTYDGKIVRIDLAKDKAETFTQTGTKSAACGAVEAEATCGRPLGLHFDADGNLIVADTLGLLSISKSGGVRVLATSANNVPLKFTDDLDIASDGRIYFSDASSKYDRAHYREDIFEGNPWGRLVRYDPKTGKTEVLLDQLYFANGVQLATDESFVLVVETARYRVRKYWLTGPRAGMHEIFVENLPGIPDNIRQSSDGGWWLALGAKRSKLVDFLHPRPLMKRIFAKLLPLDAVQQHLIPKVGLVAKLDADGKVVKLLWDASAESASQLSEAHEVEGKLYLGSIADDQLGVLDLAGL